MAEPIETPTADTERERWQGRIMGTLALAGLAFTLVSLPVGSRDVPQRDTAPNDLTQLQDVVLDGQEQAVILRLIGLALLLPVVLWLFKIVRARNPDHPRFVPLLGVLGLVTVGVATPLGFSEVREVAREFLADGPQTLQRAEQVLDEARDGGALRAANITQVVGGLLFGIWISIAAVELGRAGLTTRFLAVFGVGAGVATAIGIGAGVVLFIGWLGSVAVLALGFWPGGRPLSWETGRAIPWDEGHQSRNPRTT